MLDLAKMSLEEKKKLAQGKNTSSDILLQLSQEKNYEIQRMVASNPNTSVATLKKLSDDFPEEVANNPVFELLLREKRDSNWIKICLARSSTTSVDTLMQLAGDSHNLVLISVAENPHASSEVLHKLVNTPIPLDDYLPKTHIIVDLSLFYVR